MNSSYLVALSVRIQSFARQAVIVERAIGFPAEVMVAEWALATNWGRQQADWLDGRKVADAILTHAKLMQQADSGGGTYLEIAERLDPWFEGLHGQVTSNNLRIACEQARREVTPESTGGAAQPETEVATKGS